jgi:hypothetical protein
LYAAFVSCAIDQYRDPNAADSVSPHLISLLRAERHRLEADSPADAEAGNELKTLLRHY